MVDMEVYVLFDEEFGECEVFLSLKGAQAKMEESIADWKQCSKDKSLWLSESEYVYIFKRELND